MVILWILAGAFAALILALAVLASSPRLRSFVRLALLEADLIEDPREARGVSERVVGRKPETSEVWIWEEGKE